MKLSIIIVSYNVESFLMQCITSIKKSTISHEIDIIVVDNDSQDNSCEMVEDNFPEITLIKNQKNVGFSKAVNQGLSIFRTPFVCVLNPDALVEEDTFESILNWMKRFPKVGAVGPKVINVDGSLQKSCKRSLPTPFNAIPKLLGLDNLLPKNKWFGKYNLTYMDENLIHSVDAISGSFMLIRKEVIERVGYFDERFFMFGEDLDYSYRIKKAGFDVIYYPFVKVIHYKGESVKQSSRDMIRVFYEAMELFFEKYRNEFPSWRYFKWTVKFGIKVRELFAYIQSSISRNISILLDSLSLFIGTFLAIKLWYPIIHGHSKTFTSHIYLFFDIFISWFIVSYWIKLYKKNLLSYPGAFLNTFFTFLIASTSTYLFSIFAYSRGVLSLAMIFTAIAVCSWRIVIHLLYRFNKLNIHEISPLFTRRAAILGSSNESQRIIDVLRKTPEADFNLVGYFDFNRNPDINTKYLGIYSNVSDAIKKYHINEIIIPENHLSVKELAKMMSTIQGSSTSIKIVPSGSSVLIGKGLVENLSGLTLVNVEFPIFDKMHLIFKRLFDVFLSWLLILLFSPILLISQLFCNKKVVKIWSKNGGEETLKIIDSENQFIKKISYLFPILQGKITFVGSKMVNLDYENPELLCKPGLMGLSQLKNNEIDSSVEYYYLQHQSIIFDLEIILKHLLRV